MTNTFIAYQFPTNSTLTEAVNANKYFSFSLSNTAPLMVTNVSMCLKRLFATSPTGFTLRVSSDVGFNTYEERNFETGTNTFYVQSAADLNVFGQAVYFRLYGYGDSIGTNNAQAGFAGTTNRVANPENSGLDGTLYDLIVYGYECSEHQDSDSDGIPDSWEQQYFGAPTGANPNTLCSNGINTLRQAYIAGLNPNDPHGAFGISELRSLGMDKVLRWNAVSGRVYSVYWTTNLISGFQCLGSNISWTQGCFTNLTTEPCGYYKIDVRLEE
jgi:hypothetical protein